MTTKSVIRILKFFDKFDYVFFSSILLGDLQLFCYIFIWNWKHFSTDIFAINDETLSQHKSLGVHNVKWKFEWRFEKVRFMDIRESKNVVLQLFAKIKNSVISIKKIINFISVILRAKKRKSFGNITPILGEELVLSEKLGDSNNFIGDSNEYRIGTNL